MAERTEWEGTQAEMGLTVNVLVLFHGGFEVVCYLIKSSTFASHIMYVLNSNKEDFKSKKRKKKRGSYYKSTPDGR